MSLDEALFERRAMYSPDRAVQKYVNEYGKKEFIDGYEVGYIDGLNAAREAVAALPWKVAVSCSPIDCSQQCEHGPCVCSGVMRPEAWMTGPAEAIAAIDKLKEKP